MRSNQAAAYLADLATPDRLAELLPGVFGGADRVRRVRRFAKRHGLKVARVGEVPHYSIKSIAAAIKARPPRPPRRRRRPSAEEVHDQEHQVQVGGQDDEVDDQGHQPQSEDALTGGGEANGAQDNESPTRRAT